MITNLIISQKIDILLCQEITVHATLELAKSLNPNYHCQFYGGNCIISRYPMQNIMTHKLEESRYFILADILHPEKKFHVLVTHLDHRYEALRLKQMKAIFQNIPSRVDKTKLIIGGDFNSIYEKHYYANEIKKINKSRQLANWEEVKFDVMNYMVSQNFYPNLNKEPTSRFKTRIDFILHQPAIKSEQKVVECQHTITDHNMVIAKLTI